MRRLVIAVRSQNGVWIAYATWFIWRWLQRFPEDERLKDNPDVWKRVAS